ncbi:hypothetical protein HG531_003283 [Fusarium graminearum]|nr:hypothetical protein HG531_003283 [Fusarium graminearum]
MFLFSTARSLVLAAGAFAALNAVGSNPILVVLVPVGQNGTNLGRVGQFVNILKVSLDLLNVVLDLFNVDLLDLDEVGHASKSVERTEVTGTDVLLVGNVVVDNLEEPASLLSNVVDNELESSFVEGLADAAGVDSTHGVVGPASGITLDGNLHGETTVEHNRHQALNGHDLSKGSKGRVFTKRVTGKCAVVGHKSLGLHVLEAGLLHEGKGGLSELSGREKTSGRSVGVRGGGLVDLLKDLLGLDATVGGDGLESHGNVVLADSLTTGTTEVDGVEKVLVGAVPDLLGNRAAGVQLHTHTLLLRTLTSEDIGCSRLLNLGLTLEDLVLSFLVADLDLDYLATRDHARVLELDLKIIVGQNHTDQRSVEASDTANVVLGSPGLDEASDGGTGVHAVGDGSRKVGVAGEDTRNVNGVVVTGHAGVVLVGSRSSEGERRPSTERDGVLEVDGLINRLTISLKVVNDRVAVRLSGLVVNATNLDDLLGGELKKDLASGLDAAEDSLVLVANQALEAESQGLTEQLNVLRKLVNREPVLRSEDSDIAGGGKVNLDGGLDLSLESVLVVGVGTAVQELRSNLHDRLAITDESTTDLNHLTSLLVNDSIDLGSGRDLIALLERLSTGDHAELVRQVDELQKITIDGAREDGLGDSLPANDDSEIHRSVDSLARSVDKGLASVADGVDEVVDSLTSDGGLTTVELGSDISVQVKSLLTEPCLPVEFLDAIVTTLHNLTDRRVTGLRVVGELQRQSSRLAKSSSLLDHVDLDLVLADKLDLDHIDVLVVAGLLADNNGCLRRIVGVRDLNKQTTRRSKDASDGVGLELLTLGNNISHEQSMTPVTVRASEERQPRVKLREADGQALNIKRNLGVNKLATEILDVGDGSRVVVVLIPGEVLDGVLLEVELEVVVKDRNESDRLLSRSHAHDKEVLDILSVDDLSLGIGVGGENAVDDLERIAELGVALEERGLARGSGQTLLETVNVITDKNSEFDETSQNLGVSHVIEIDSLALLVATEPDLLAIIVELLDVVVLVLLELGNALLLGKAEDLLVHLGPEANSTSSELVDRLAHLGSDSKNTASRSLVGLLPLAVLKTGSSNNGLLGGLAGVSLLGNHHAATEQATIERHGRVAVLLGPVTSDVGVGVIGTTETTTGNENDVLLSSDTAIHLENRVMEILERVVTTTTTSGPLKHNREVGVGLGDVDDGLDGIKRTRLEADVLKAKGLNVLLCNLDRRNTSTDGKTLDGNTLRSELLDQRNLPSHGTRVDIDQLGAELLDPIDGVLDGVLLIAVEELSLVAKVVHATVDGTSQDDADTSALLVSAGQNTESRNTTRAEVQNVSGVREDGGLLPVDRVASDQANQSRDDVTLNLLSKILASVGIKDSNSEIARVDVDVLQILVDHGSGLRKVLAVERSGDGQESVGEANLSLSEGDSVLIQANGGLDLSQLGVKTVERGGRSCHNQVSGAVDEGDADVTVLGKVLVGSVNVLLNLSLRKISDTKHRNRASGVVAADKVQLLGLNAGQVGGNSVGFVATEEIALKLVKDELQDLLVGASIVILTLIDLVGDEIKVSGNQVGN